MEGFFMDKETLEKINQEVDKILCGIKYNNSSMVDTNAVLEYLSKEKNIIVKFSRVNFSNISKKFANMGAYMIYKKENNKKIYKIFINSNHNVVYQRFSLAHEIGHLCLEDIDNLPEGKIALSTHIDYKLIEIDEKKVKNNQYLLNEQKANIFALKLLMPEKALKISLLNFNSIDDISKAFGVDNAAVFSRLSLLNN